MIKIYIGIEDGIIGAVYCDQIAELTMVSVDRERVLDGEGTLVTEENLTATSSEDITAFIEQAKAEEKQSIKDWNDYQVTEDK